MSRGFGAVVLVMGTVGRPVRRLMFVSQPIMKAPILSSDVLTSWPSPVRSRTNSAAATPPAAAMPVMWSPIPPRW